jgi:oxygen-independent coproporphyrinogen-3 oxidase
MNHRSTTTWLRRVLAGDSPVAERDVLAPSDRARELLVIGLRRIEGVDRFDFHRLTGFNVDELAGKAIARHVRSGFLADDGTRVQLTREGLFVSDALWPDFL